MIDTAETQPPPLKGLHLVVATLALGVGTLLFAMDQFIANVSIPTISGDLGVSQDNGVWVITSYTVANAIMVPLTGWFTGFFGRVRLFSLSAILFSIMSLLCGLSTSFPMLIIFRIFQGLVSGSLIPLSQTLLLLLYPKHKGFAMGMWGLVVMVGPALGPVIGGWITYNYNWTWIFNINVPLGILSGVIAYAVLSEYESKRFRLPIDTLGLVLLALMVGSFQVMIDRGNDDDWFRSNFILTLAIVAFISFCFFLVWEWFHPTPMVNLSFFKSRNFNLGTFTTTLCSFAMFGTLVVGPNWAQLEPLGYTPLWAGYSIAFFGLGGFIFFPLVGILLHRLDIRVWIAIGFALQIPSFFYMAYLPIDTPFFNFAIPRLFQGIGFAFFFVPLLTIAVSGIPEKKLASATGIVTFVRMLGISSGVSLSTTFFTRRENFFQSRYVESVIPSNPQFEPYYQALETHAGLTGQHADAAVYEMVQGQAFTQSFLDLSWMIAWAFIAFFLVIFLLRSEKAAHTKAARLK